MSNSYFQFRQFTIQQGKCAMKVTTDGCLFGAIASRELENIENAKILDIGTGTGLLSLIIAQQNAGAIIDAIEIDASAAQQAGENVAVSPWAEQVKVITGDILDYASANLYDVIISNPPFYEKQLASPDAGRRQAHHSSDLTLQQLFQEVVRLLKPDGIFFVMMPYYRSDEAIAVAKSNEFFVEKHWQVKQTPIHGLFRSIFCFRLQNVPAYQPITICIGEQPNIYSTAFTGLLEPYYLKL